MSDLTNTLMRSGLIEIGADGQAIEPVLVLSSRGGHKIGVIENVQSIEQTHPLSDVAELSFDVYKEIDGIKCSLWDKIKDFKFVQNVYDNTWYEAHVTIDEENDVVKHVTCTHANETELAQLNLYEVEINTEADIGRDDYVETFFYDEENPKASLLNRILHDKAPHYSIYHVDDSLKGLFRTFSFNGTSIKDALNTIAEEVNCLFVYGEWDEDDGKYHRTISAYDLEDYCYECKKRGNYSDGTCTNCGSTNIKYGYGRDTGIFVSRENLATSINYEGNADEVKNCFHLVAGDDLMTATVKSCNPSMSQYLWHFSEEFLDDMSDELKAKIIEYQNLVDTYKNTKDMELTQSLVQAYNALVTKYKTYNNKLEEITFPVTGTTNLTDAYYKAMYLYGWLKSEMMPQAESVATTTAEEQMDILETGTNMSEVGIADASGTIPYTSANSAIQSYAKVYIDTARYKVSVFTNSINNKIWNGTITITSYIDDEDTATATFTITLFDSTDSTKYTQWVEQSVKKAMANRESTNIGVVDLFKAGESLADFKTRLKLYGLDYLNTMANMATSAITVMTEQGIPSAANTATDVYQNVYLPYLNKSKAIQEEILIREAELADLLQAVDENGDTDARYPSLGLIDIIEGKQVEVRNALDIKTFLGDTLWDELSYYRREDEYSNSNYISDGLTDSEVVQYARRFVEAAEKEIIKASTLQHTISAPLVNFLLLPEFATLQQNFKVGNWIRLEVDGKVYKLRLANWTIDYDSIEDLDVEFTDVVYTGNTLDDVASILSKSKSMATSYDYTAKQADKGKDAAETLKSYKSNGVDFRKIKAIKSKGNTDIIYDDDGILLRRVRNGNVLPEQTRIYNNGIYLTDDNWATVRSGLGYFSYVDPETNQTVRTYGIVADTVIGKLIIGDSLKIFTQSGRFKITNEGFTANNGTYTVKIDPEAQTASQIFSIYKTQTPTDRLAYIDTNGDLTVKGNINAKTLSTGNKTSSATGQNGLFIDSNGNLYSGSLNQTQIKADGTFQFGGSNGISFDGTNITLGNKCSISWNNVTDTSGVAMTSDIPTTAQITQITRDTVTTSYVNALNITAANVAAENITGTTISGKTISGGTITGSSITGGTISGTTITGAKITADTFVHDEEDWTVTMADGFVIRNKSENVTTSYYITAPSGGYTDTTALSVNTLDFKCHNYGGSLYFDSEGFHFNRAVEITNITSNNSAIYFITSTTSLAVSNSVNAFIPTTTTATSLGISSRLWTTVYAQNTTINSSDSKYKDILGSIDFAENLIMSLNPTRFMWKDGDHRRTRMGFIAQDVAKVCKDINENLALVTASYIDDETKDYFGEEADDSKLVWGISYEQLIAPMVAVIQKQNKRINDLEAIVSSLTA